MRELTKVGAFVLLGAGTIGLLANEFVCDFGRPATLTFASMSGIGLMALVISNWVMKERG
jgi:hypothetical protein